MILDNVRIPRENLLSRYMSVDKEGTFSIEGDLRILYATMMGVRSRLLETAPFTLLLGNLIAIRYSVVRR